MTATSLVDLLAPHLALRPDFPVLTFEGGGRRPDDVRSYRDLWLQGHRLAWSLTSLGMRPGQRFALLMANHAGFVEAMLAAAVTGTVFVPIDPRTRGDKLAWCLANADCQGVIAADYALPALLDVRNRVPRLRWIAGLATDEGPAAAMAVPGVLAYADLTRVDRREHPLHRHGADSPMQLLFTSGTTGDPKAIVMTQQRFCATAGMVKAAFGYEGSDCLYSGLSLTHANAQLVTLGAALAHGLRAVFSRRFTKSRLWDICRRHGCTSFSLLGGMTVAVYAEPPRPDDRDHPVRTVVSAGMPASIWPDFARRFGVGIVEFYGTAEGGLAVNPPGTGPVGSIGRPPAFLQHRIVDPAGRDCAPGVPGELCFRAADGSPFQVEYFGNPQASAAKCADGWLHTGDVVCADAEGWLFFRYREGGGIRHNGEFVTSALIEKAVAELPEVDDVYVYGRDAESGAPGEKDVVVAVVPRTDGFDAQQVFRLCREQLPPHYVPTFVQVLPAIPKTASEKPQDRFLLEAFAAHPASVHREARPVPRRAPARAIRGSCNDR